MDKEWLETLAKAKLTNGSWQPENPSIVERTIAKKIPQMVNQLFAELKDACLVFNQFAPITKQLTLLPLYENHTELTALMLLVGRSQIQIKPENRHLHLSLFRMAGFRTEVLKTLVLTAKATSCGAITWQPESKEPATPFNTELLASFLIEEILDAYGKENSEWE